MSHKKLKPLILKVSVLGYFPLGYPYYNTGCPYSDMGTEYGHPVIYGIKRLNNILKSQ